MMSKPKKILFAIAVGLVGLLIFINLDTTRVQYLPFVEPIQLPLFLVLFTCFAAGIFTGVIWSWMRSGKKKEPDKP